MSTRCCCGAAAIRSGLVLNGACSSMRSILAAVSLLVGEKNYARSHPEKLRGRRPLRSASPYFSGSPRHVLLLSPASASGMRMPVPLMNMDRPRVLLAEDNADTADRLRKLLRAEFD